MTDHGTDSNGADMHHARVGIFLCRCGENISGLVDLEALQAELSALPEVSFVAAHNLLCAPDGKRFFAEEMARHGGTHAVVAACSPKDHERDFQEAMQEAGLNPYLLYMANIREHCAWVTRDRAQAGAKALAQIRAGLRRVRLHEALERRQIPCNADLLVIGGGVAGVEAALAAAQDGRRVTLVEASPAVGGMAALFEDLSPDLECASCMLAPRLSALSEAHNIEVLTDAEVEDLVGFLGSFTARIRVQARRVDPQLCLGCGCDECINACPAEAPEELDLGLGMRRRKAIFLPLPGGLPNCAAIDELACLRMVGEDCTRCAGACPMEAVRLDQQDEVREVNAGAVILATGASTFDPALGTAGERLGLGRLPEVYTHAQVERLLSGSGPTGGKLLMRSGEPPRGVAVVHCVGRAELGYCSGFCCQAALKLAPLLAHREVDCQVTHLHADLVLPRRAGASLQQRALAAGARLLRVEDPGGVRVEADGEALVVRAPGPGGQELTVQADMVILACGMTQGRATARLCETLELVCDDTGFPALDHPMLRPAQSSRDGVYLAGCAAGPRDIAGSISSAQAAAGQAAARVRPGATLEVEVLTAVTDPDLCSGCQVCVVACPYRACSTDPSSGRVAVNEVLCRGCGCCVAACASGAARARQFSDHQLRSEIEEVLHG